MSEFKVSKNQEGEAVTFVFEGSIDEDAVFSGLEAAGAQSVSLDLDNVKSINSCGIREWIKWVKTIPGESKITYKKCPKVIVDQINMVAGFLPDNAKVESFYVPYFSEDSGNEKMVLFEEGKDFNGGEVTAPDEFTDEETGDEMEMDVIESKYFKFLNK
ncbi:MAG: hypothetical protein HRT45_06505 [Bdellovibrionales bacterium]|nr:hypothetical protein [Bdellovibrionales bacterium]